MKKEEKEVVLQVLDPDPTHVGRNIITLDKETKEALGITSGEIVEIEGVESKKKTAGIVWPARTEDEGRKVVRMDSFTRHNAGVGLNEKVRIRRVVPKEAKKVVLAPIEEVRIIASGYDRILKKSFLGRPLSVGDNVWVSVFGSGFIYSVVDTAPRGIVKVVDTTQFALKEKPVKDALEGIPRVAYEDIGGLDEQVQKVREMVELPMKHPELFQKLGIVPPKGILLYGPPGTGKTLLAKAVANEAQVHFISVSAPEVMGKFVGEAEERVRKIFQEANENAPSIIFIDEIDAIAPKRDEVVGEVERRVVAQILSLMDGLAARGEVIVMAATNRVNSLDEALRRPGRFDREIEFGVPDKKARKEIFSIHTRGMPLNKDVDLGFFASITHGFVGADLQALSKEAAMKALRRYLPKIDLEEETIPAEVLENLMITKQDFLEGLKDVQPSALREVAIEIPNVHWNDIGGLENVKQELKQAVEWPLKKPDAFKDMGIRPPRGILLYGPPGTGKTLLARAVATESEANFISVKGPELLSMWVGESLPFDEELLVFDGKKIFREKIGVIVEEKKDYRVVSFDNDGKAIFSRIDGFVKHPLDGKLLEVITKTGRKIRVTEKHSLFSLVNNRLESVTPKQLVCGESVLAVPSKIPNISLSPERINLLDFFSDDSENYFIESPQIREAIRLLGYKRASGVTGISKKYLYDICFKKLPMSLSAFTRLVKEAGIVLKPEGASVFCKGARQALPALFDLSNDFFEFLGIWVAEGDINCGVPRLHVYNPEIIDRVSSILKKMGIGYSVFDEGVIVANSTTLAKLMERMGLLKGAHNKNVPWQLFVSGSSAVYSFLKGYFSGDGTISSNGHSYFVEATTVSNCLANDLLYLLLKVGIVASCKDKPEWSGSVSKRIQIFGADNLRKFSLAGFIDSERNNLLREYIAGVSFIRSNRLPLNAQITAVLREAFGSYPSNQSVEKSKLVQALCLIDLNKQRFADLWWIIEADLFWDVVVEINEVDYSGFVYDISVEPCQNFLSGFGGVFAHNSEKGIRKVFRRARQVAPCIVFFDEIDAVASKRGSHSGTRVYDQMVNQILTELDSVEAIKDVVFIAATNRPDLIDTGLLRPGRIDKLIHVPAPDEKAREAILKVHTKGVKLDKSVSIKDLARKTNGFSGADLSGLVREAALLVLQQNNLKVAPVTAVHFEEILKKMKPTIDDQTTKAYQEFAENALEYRPTYVR